MVATGISSSDRSYCQDVACIPGSVFSITSRFLKTGFRDELLVLHALTAEIRSIPFRVSDPGLAIIKLDWWRQELTPHSASNSQHPVVRALVQSGVLERLNPILLNGYVSAVAHQASADVIPDIETLQDQACRIGGAEVLMEASLDESILDKDALVLIGAAAFLNRLLHNIGVLICGESWWLPVDLQAKYGLTLGGLRLGSDNSGLNSTIETLCNLALDLLNNGRQTLRRLNGGKGQSGRANHLLISAAVHENRLRRLRSTPSRHAHRGVAAGEVLAAWRQAIRR